MHLLTERSLSRVLRRLENGEVALLISGCRGDNTYKENLSATRAIRNALSKNGFSYHKIRGGYAESGNKAVFEESTMAYAPKEDANRLLSLGKKLGKAYEQDSILFVHSLNSVSLYYTNDVDVYDDDGDIIDHIPEGTVENLGKFRAKQVGMYFTQVKNKRFSFVPSDGSNSELNEGIIIDPRLYRPEDVTPMERLARRWKRF